MRINTISLKLKMNSIRFVSHNLIGVYSDLMRKTHASETYWRVKKRKYLNNCKIIQFRNYVYVQHTGREGQRGKRKWEGVTGKLNNSVYDCSINMFK